jgi:HAMP domain
MIKGDRIPLAVRIFLIVMGGMVLALTVSHFLHERDRAEHFEARVTRRADQHFVDVVVLLAAASSSERVRMLDALPRKMWRFESHQHLAPPTGFSNPRLFSDLKLMLKDRVDVLSAWTDPDFECPDRRFCRISLGVQIRFQDDQRLSLIFTSLPEKPHSRALWPLIRDRYLPFILIMAAVSWYVVRLVLRPIHRMKVGIENFGQDISQPALEIIGPIELRQMIETFNRMQEQIRAFMADRTQMLAAITHDLKTPLTRIRLRLEDLTESKVRDKLLDDLTVMQTLIDEGLDLAKSLNSTEVRREVELTFLIQSICPNRSFQPDGRRDCLRSTARTETNLREPDWQCRQIRYRSKDQCFGGKR